MDGDGVICPVCSVLNAPGANFCSACGASLPEVDEVATGSYPVVGVDVAGAGEVGQLIVTRGGTAGARFALAEPEVRIGRHPDSSIFLDDVTVSRRHARILVEHDHGDVPLREIVVQFNRRNTVQLVLEDAALGERNVGGVIALDQVEAFVRLLVQDGDIVAEPRAANEILLRRAR